MKPKPKSKQVKKVLPAGELKAAAPSPPPPPSPPAASTPEEIDFAQGRLREAAADVLAAELEREDQLPARIDGKFAPGQSGNPAGRPLGSKNYVTEMRLAMEAALRAYMHQPTRRARIFKLMDRVLEIGLTGADKEAINAAKLVFASTLSAAKQEDEAGGKTPPRVVVVIENMTAKPAKAIVVTEGQFTEVHDMKESGQMTDDENAGSVGTTQLPEDIGNVLMAATLEDGGASAKGSKAQKGNQTGTDTP